MWFNMFPALQKSITSVGPTMPENASLLLPSTFNQPYQTQLGLDKVAEIEYQIREGTAHEALDAVCMAIRHSMSTSSSRLNMSMVRGQTLGLKTSYVPWLQIRSVLGDTQFRANSQLKLPTHSQLTQPCIVLHDTSPHIIGWYTPLQFPKTTSMHYWSLPTLTYGCPHSPMVTHSALGTTWFQS